MNYQTAITTAKSGTPVRRHSWETGRTINLITQGSESMIGTRKTIVSDIPYVASQEDMFADDWET